MVLIDLRAPARSGAGDGADAFVTLGAQEVREALGRAPQVLFEAVGAEGMLARAVNHAAPFGRIVSPGFRTSPDPLIPATASYECVSIRFSVGYSMKEFIYIAGQMDKGHCDPKAIISRDIRLEGLPAMFDAWRGANAETKAHVRPDAWFHARRSSPADASG